MQSFSLAPVPEIAFGNGLLSDLPKRVTALAGKGAPVMLVADPAMTASGIVARLKTLFAEAGHEMGLYDAFKGEPKAGDVDKATTLAHDAGAKAVIGLGGGTALD